jgi:hypothetical protein
MVRKAVIFLFSSFSILSVQIGVFGGVGNSNFDLADGADQSAYVPLGITLDFVKDIIHLGAEVSYSATNFTLKESIYGSNSEISQLLIGGFIKVRKLTNTKITFFLRAGGGYYMGALVKKNFQNGNSITQEFEGTFGFNFGGGIEFNMMMGKLYFEFVYYNVKRRFDVDGAVSSRMDNYAGHMGYIFML